jgi:hypothetical protein
MRWFGPGVGPYASSRLEAFAHLADADGCGVGEDLGASGGGSESKARSRWSVPILFVPEQDALAQAGFEDFLRFRW